MREHRFPVASDVDYHYKLKRLKRQSRNLDIPIIPQRLWEFLVLHGHIRTGDPIYEYIVREIGKVKRDCLGKD